MSRIRFGVFVLVLLFSVSAFAVGSTRTEYYSDSTFTTQVGAKYVPNYDCPSWDLWYQWGSVTAYKKVFTYSDCDEQGTVTVRCYISGSLVTCP